MPHNWKWIGLLLMGMVVAGFVGSLLARRSDRFFVGDPAPPTATLTPTVTLTPTATLRPTVTPTVTATSTPISASLATVTARQLLQDFRDNEIRGDQLHKGKVKYVVGLVDAVRDDGRGYYIELGYEGDEWEFGQVRCQLRNPEEAAALSEGQSLTVQGRIAGLDLFDIVEIEDCAVAKMEAAPLEAEGSAQADASANEFRAAAGADTVAAQQLLQDFRDNEFRGDQLHKDKVKSVAGLVRDIRDDGRGYYVELGYAGDEWEFGQVRCQLRNPEEAIALSEGQSLTVQGRIAGLDLLDIVVIEDCTVAAVEAATLDEGLATPVPALIPSTAAPLRSTVQVDLANLRAGPSTDYDAVGSARRGETVEPMARNAAGDWLRLRNGAWIYASLVDRVPENLPVADATQTEPAATVEPVWMTRYKRYQDMSAEAFWDEYLPFVPQEDDRGQCGFSMILAAAEAAGLQDTPAYAVVRQLGEGEVGDVDAAWYMNHCDWTSPSGSKFYQAYTIYSIVLLEAGVDNSGLRDDRLFMLAVRIGDLLEAAAGNPDLRGYYENMARQAWCLFADC